MYHTSSRSAFHITCYMSHDHVLCYTLSHGHENESKYNLNRCCDIHCCTLRAGVSYRFKKGGRGWVNPTKVPTGPASGKGSKSELRTMEQVCTCHSAANMHYLPWQRLPEGRLLPENASCWSEMLLCMPSAAAVTQACLVVLDQLP